MTWGGPSCTLVTHTYFLRFNRECLTVFKIIKKTKLEFNKDSIQFQYFFNIVKCDKIIEFNTFTFYLI